MLPCKFKFDSENRLEKRSISLDAFKSDAKIPPQVLEFIEKNRDTLVSRTNSMLHDSIRTIEENYPNFIKNVKKTLL